MKPPHQDTTTPKNQKITLLLLAAGMSRRMGVQNKLLLPWKGRSLIHAMAEAINGAEVKERIVITGHEANQIEKALADYPFHFVHNPAYETGMTSSIQAGIQAASIDSTAYLIALSDLPRLTAQDLNHLIQEFEKLKTKAAHPILVPTYQGRRGHPLIFDAHYRSALLAHQAPDGCRDLLKQYATNVHNLEMPDDRILADIDHPKDYQQIK